MRVFSLIVFLFICGSFAKAPVTEDKFTEIRSICRQIDKDVKLNKLIKKALNQMSVYLGSSTGYYNGKTIRYIHGDYGGEGSNMTTADIYFEEGKLIFYKKSTNVNTGGKFQTQEFYFQDDKMFRWKNGKGKLIVKTDTTFAEREKEILKMVQRSVEELKEQR